MCGRYRAWVEDGVLMRLIEREQQGDAARYFRRDEVFPGTSLPVLYAAPDDIRVHLSTWGIPIAAGQSLINARSETADVKPTFRGALAGSPTERRILVMASGYYEWETAEKGERIRRHLIPAEGEDGVLFLAGLEVTRVEHRHVILTTASRGEAAVHPRMPLFLRRREVIPWLTDPAFARRRIHEPWMPDVRMAE